MKILLSSDFHSDFTKLFEYASNVDLCICCGDVFDYHKGPSDDFSFPIPFYSIKGNKELWGGAKLHAIMQTTPNFYWLNEHLQFLFEQTGFRFWGLDHLQIPTEIPGDIDIIVSHEPAYGLADQCSDPFHVKTVLHCGNKQVRKIFDESVPKFLIAGHVHNFQIARTEKSMNITLSPALSDPLIILDTKSKKLMDLTNKTYF